MISSLLRKRMPVHPKASRKPNHVSSADWRENDKLFVRLVLAISLNREALVFQINRFVIGNRIKLGRRNSLRDAITKKHRNTAWKIEVRSNNGCIAAGFVNGGILTAKLGLRNVSAGYAFGTKRRFLCLFLSM